VTDVAVIGAGGQLGRELVARAWPDGVRVIALGRADVDLRDGEAIRSTLLHRRPDIVVNAAAYTAVDRAESESDVADAVNHLAPGAIARACADVGARMVQVSTDYVFDGSKSGPYQPDDPIAPLNVYGATKASGEDVVRASLREHLILRTSWVVSGHGQNFVRTMLRLAREKDELRVVNDQQGCLTNATDLAEAIGHVIERWLRDEEAPTYGTFHYAGAGAATWFDIAREVVALQTPHSGRSPAVIPIPTTAFPTPARRPANSVLDSSALVARYGVAQHPWRSAAQRTVRSLLEKHE
jgi:dTDP-4-dehydrorhamnose reductase